jgi:hypothetical protein
MDEFAPGDVTMVVVGRIVMVPVGMVMVMLPILVPG